MRHFCSRAWRASLAVFFLALAVGLAAAPARALNVKVVKSPGGITGWLIEDASVPLFSLEFAFRGGSALDPKGKEGLANLLSGLLDEGAGDLDSKAYRTRLEDNSIGLRFSAGRDSFGGTLRALTEHRALAARLLRLALTAPRFDAAPLERVRGQLLSEVRRRAERPSSIARRAFRKLVFGDHPYGRSRRGREQSLKAITADDLRRFVARRFARDNLIVGAVGDIDEATFARLLDEVFGALPRRAAPADIAEARIGGAGKLVVVEKDIPQSVAIFGQAGIKRDDPDYYAARVMNQVLGGGSLTSRLGDEVREKRGLAYSVSTGLATYDHAGLLFGRVDTANARIKESLDVIRAEWARMAKGGVTAEELEDAKRYLTGAFFTRLNSTGRIAGVLVDVQLQRLGADYLDKRNGLIEAVTLTDVRRVAKRLLKPKELTVVIVGKPRGVSPVN